MRAGVRESCGVLMATFGSFALLIALALAAYNLFAGAMALEEDCAQDDARRRDPD